MANHLKKVKSGDPLAIPASTFNAFVAPDVTDAFVRCEQRFKDIADLQRQAQDLRNVEVHVSAPAACGLRIGALVRCHTPPRYSLSP